MATSFTTHSAGQVIASADINLIQTAVNTLENAGGGGGAVGTYIPWTSIGASGTSFAFKGVMFTPSKNMSIQSISANMGTLTAAGVYQAFVVTLTSNSVGTTTVATRVGSSAAVTCVNGMTAGGQGVVNCHFATPAALTSGTTYCLLFGFTSFTSTSILPINSSVDFSTSIVIDQVPGTLSNNITCTSVAPNAGDTAAVTATTSSRFCIGMTASF